MTETQIQMSLSRRATNEEVIDAYRRTGSVWRAGKELGVSGQRVHQLLRRLEYPMLNAKWSDDEEGELRNLIGHLTIGEMADRLGRSYAGVACKISELGIGDGGRGTRQVKLPRGAGYDKANVKRYIKAIDSTGVSVHRYAKANGLGVEMLCQSLQRHFPDWWEAYRAAHSDLPEMVCGYCERTFVPSTKKQEYCSRKCGTDRRKDLSYFSGNRRKAIGWAEGVCQVCGRQPDLGLTPHHVLGKENDPSDSLLVAVCRGCHQLVTALGNQDFTREQWESLISLSWLRKHGPQLASRELEGGLWVCVEIELEPVDEEDEDEGSAA